jgi:hypothetical protein
MTNDTNASKCVDNTAVMFRNTKQNLYGRPERILTMVYVVKKYWAYFGLYPSSCMWKTKNPTTFRRLDLSLSSGGWGQDKATQLGPLERASD